jgi:hypothetical protein
MCGCVIRRRADPTVQFKVRLHAFVRHVERRVPGQVRVPSPADIFNIGALEHVEDTYEQGDSK